MSEKNMKVMVRAIIKDHEYDSLSVITVIQDVQKELRYLPIEAFEIISKEMGNKHG